MDIHESIAIAHEAYDVGQFQQLCLLPRASFVSHLGERELRVSSDELERLGEFIQPVERLSDGETLFHPYQTWIVQQLTSRLVPQVSWAFWRPLQAEQIVEHVNQARALVTPVLDRFRAAARDFYSIIALTSLTEPYYLPLIRSRLSLRGGSGQDYARWRTSFDLHAVLDRCEVGPEHVRAWHERLAMDAWVMDAAQEWYPLIRYARFGKRERLRGSLRLAHDYYEMAEILRGLYYGVTGEKLPPENEHGAIPWTTGAHTASGPPVLERVALKREVRSFGLDAGYRGYWFVEGDTEQGFYEELSTLAGTSLEEAGIAVVNLGGGGQIARIRAEVERRFNSDAFVEQLKTYRSDEIFVYFVVDNDDGIRDGLERLKRMALVTAGCTMWSSDFEEASFTTEELIDLVIATMGASGSPEAQLTVAEVDAARTDRAGRPRSLGEALEVAAGRKLPLRGFGKGREWGKTLARYAREHPTRNGQKRPALRVFDYCLAMSWAAFQASLEHVECDLSTKAPDERGG